MREFLDIGPSLSTGVMALICEFLAHNLKTALLQRCSHFKTIRFETIVRDETRKFGLSRRRNYLESVWNDFCSKKI